MFAMTYDYDVPEVHPMFGVMCDVLTVLVLGRVLCWG